MNTPAIIARKSLVGRYRELYGEQFNDLSDKYLPKSKFPTWLWLDENLNPKVDTEQNSSLLLDPEIGLCLYLLPFSRENDVQSQISHALKIRSRLLPRTGLAPGKGDNAGSWRVLIHWFVDANNSESWVKQVGELRGETAHFEEISIDAIFNNVDDWEKSISSYSFHRLLFKTRFVLRKKTKDEVDNWSSADVLVEKTINKFPEHFKTEQLKGYAQEVTKHFEQLLEGRKEKQKPDDNHQKSTLNNLEISNFRSIDELKFSFDDKGRGAGAWLIHGPNGTGKSSVYEALSFALCGTSYRCEQYERDKNNTARNKFNNYLNQYLQPLGEILVDPSVIINGKEVSINGQTGEGLNTVSGTMLSQEQSSEFVRMEDSELGAQIVGESSLLANEIRAYVERRYNLVREEQKSFFNRWDLNKNIKNVQTAKQRIAEKSVTDKLYDQEQVIAWLNNTNMHMFSSLDQTISYYEDWEKWRDKRQQVVKDISKQKSDSLKNYLLDLLKNKNDIAQKTEVYFEGIKEMTLNWDYDLESDIKLWGEWLEKQRNTSDSDSDEINDLRGKQQRLQKEQQKVSNEGQHLNKRIEHLDLVDNFLLGSDWSKTHGDECPTCATDLTDRNGLTAVIIDIRTESTVEVEEKRRIYTEVTGKLKNIETKLSALGAVPPPIEAERQAELLQMTQWLFSSRESDLREELIIDANRNQLLAIISHLRQIPISTYIPNEEQLESVAEQMSAELSEAFARVVIASSEENAWREIQTTLTGLLSTLVDKHLPKTLQGLWVELSLNLTTARWQLPGEFAFTVDTKRNQPVANVSVDVGEFGTRLARYILNEAEVHVLGLSWFIVRYLTFGRFNFDFLVMDDPAQEMDQPTYRELCRLWETFLRLHLQNEISFKLIVLLHQDERALDAARATGGILHFLKWNKGKTELLRSTRLLGETYIAPLPEAALGIDREMQNER